VTAFDLRQMALIGFSTGGGEVCPHIGRRGTERVAKVALVSAIPPFMLQPPANPGGVPIEVCDGLHAACVADRSQFYKDLADGPFFGANYPAPTSRRACVTRSAAKHAVRAQERA
jgi:non-heme chloroperoxidase